MSSIIGIVLLTFTLQAKAQSPVILAIGDSMTAGYGVDPESSYPAQLEKELHSRGFSYRVINHGVTGSTTTQALGRMTRALGLQPSIVLVQLGGNDNAQGIPRNVSKENLRKIIQRFQPGGARILFLGGRFPHLDELAAELHVPVVPFLEGVRGNRDLLLADGAHPTAEGYSIVIQNVLKVLDPILSKGSVP